MIATLSSLIHRRFTPTVLGGLLAAAAIGAIPTAALADRHDVQDRGHDRVSRDDDRHGRERGDQDNRSRGGFRLDIEIHNRPSIERVPAYEDREVRVWVEPVYRTVTNRVWVADRYETREVDRYDHGRRERWEERVLVEPAHYEDVCRQELVCEGHWETHMERVAVDAYRH